MAKKYLVPRPASVELHPIHCSCVVCLQWRKELVKMILMMVDVDAVFYGQTFETAQEYFGQTERKIWPKN